jgi:hypothetical protein
MKKNKKISSAILVFSLCSLALYGKLLAFSAPDISQTDFENGELDGKFFTLRNISGSDKTSSRSVPTLTSSEYYPPYIALAIKVGTLGPGAELTFGITDTINIRAGGNYLPIDFSGKIDKVKFETELRWASVPVLVDWHIFGNNFRVTGGLIYNRNEVDLDAKLKEDKKIGDNRYSPEEVGTLKGTADFKKWAPYAGIGYGNAVGGPDTVWNFVFDIGVMFQGKPDVDLTANGTMSGNPIFEDDLDELRKDVQDKADYFKFYPVISFGISYQF